MNEQNEQNKIVPKVIFRCGDIVFQKWEARTTSDGKTFTECYQVGKITKKLNRATQKWEAMTQIINVKIGELVQLSYVIEAAIGELEKYGKNR